MPKVSVIIPVYGVEKYIERCARSLFEQTLDDMEYLFIDDCTPDNSIGVLKMVLDEYPSRKSQVQIHRMAQNSGQAKVREWGMKNATGEYVIHCDSDDWVDNDIYRNMYEVAIEANADMVACGYYIDGNSPHPPKLFNAPRSNHELISQMLLGKYPSYMWNKLVRVKALSVEDVKWPVNNMWEDMAIMIQIVPYLKKVVVVNKPLYHYVIREDSIVNMNDKKNVIKKWNQVNGNVKLILDCIKTNEYNEEILVLKSKARYHLVPLLYDDDIWKLYKNAYPDLTYQMMTCRLFSLKNKVRDLLYESKWLHKWAFRKFSDYSK